MRIEHLNPDCVGTWEARGSARRLRWGCRACGADAPEGVSTAVAALHENVAGLLLRTLELRGRQLLRHERERH